VKIQIQTLLGRDDRRIDKRDFEAKGGRLNVSPWEKCHSLSTEEDIINFKVINHFHRMIEIDGSAPKLLMIVVGIKVR
jgi:hypothetical protein